MTDNLWLAVAAGLIVAVLVTALAATFGGRTSPVAPTCSPPSATAGTGC